LSALTQDDQRDKDTLQRLLRAISAFLSWLVSDSGFVPEDIRDAFRDILPIVQERLSTAAGEFAAIDDTEDETWQRLDDAGMIGRPLRLKVEIWNRTVAAVSAPPSPATGFVGRALRPLTKLVNSVLGSLTAAFPPLELVKEYKDGIEVVVQEQHQGNPLPGRILDLR